MDEFMRRSRNSLNDWAYEHFKGLEEAIKNSEEMTAKFALVIEERETKILQLREQLSRDELTTAIQVGEQDLEIAQLKQQLQDARNQVVALTSAEEERLKRTVQSTNDNDEDGKPVRPLKTLAKDVTPPAGSPAGIARLRPAISMDPVPHIDSGTQTNHGHPPLPLGFDYPEAYAELLAKYHELVQDHDEQMGMYGDLKQENTNLKKEMDLIRSLKSYKNAYDILNEKYHQDKARWKVWLENYRKKEVARAERKLNTEVENVLMTPGPTSSPPRPPASSPGSSLANPNELSVELVRTGRLFSNLQPSRKVNFQFGPNDVGEPERNIPNEEAIHSDASSYAIPETQEQDQPQLPQSTQKPAGNPDRNTDPDHPTSDLTSSDTGDEGEITPRAKIPIVDQQMHPPTHFKTPVPANKEGASWAKPVVIKSEPLSSQDDPGYHLFDQESLDLDDVGHLAPQEQQITPRKRRKADIIKQAIKGEGSGNGDETHDGDENDVSLPHKIRPNMIAEADTLLPPPPRPRVQKPVSIPVQKTDSPSGRLGPISTSASAFRTPIKATKRALRSRKGAHVPVLEDGADGKKPVGLGGDTPSVQTAVRLDDILFTPPPKSVSLSALSKEAINTRSAPQNRRPKLRAEGKDMLTTPNNPTLKKRDAATDPLPSKNIRKQPATAADFAINPAMNDGIDYAYHEVVRNREARKCLPGCTRTCCKEVGKFVEAAGMPLLTKAGPRWRSSSPEQPAENTDAVGEKEFLDLYGRHREAFPRRNTPPGFWDSDMPDTQALKKRNEEADKLDRERVEQRNREVMKGSKGRFVRKF